MELSVTDVARVVLVVSAAAATVLVGAPADTAAFGAGLPQAPMPEAATTAIVTTTRFIILRRYKSCVGSNLSEIAHAVPQRPEIDACAFYA